MEYTEGVAENVIVALIVMPANVQATEHPSSSTGMLDLPRAQPTRIAREPITDFNECEDYLEQQI